MLLDDLSARQHMEHSVPGSDDIVDIRSLCPSRARKAYKTNVEMDVSKKRSRSRSPSPKKRSRSRTTNTLLKKCKDGETVLPSFLNDAVVHTVIGDGTCLFHAILYATSQKYRDASKSDQSKLGRNLRKRLANSSRAEANYSKLSEANHVFQTMFPTFDTFKTFMSNTREWATDEIVQYVSYVLQLNLFVVRKTSLKFLKGCTLTSTPLRFHTSWPSIILLNNDVHFEPLAIDEQFQWDPGSEVNRSLRRFDTDNKGRFIQIQL
jgi:hypothetical protein